MVCMVWFLQSSQPVPTRYALQVNNLYLHCQDPAEKICEVFARASNSCHLWQKTKKKALVLHVFFVEGAGITTRPGDDPSSNCCNSHAEKWNTSLFTSLDMVGSSTSQSMRTICPKYLSSIFSVSCDLQLYCTTSTDKHHTYIHRGIYSQL